MTACFELSCFKDSGEGVVNILRESYAGSAFETFFSPFQYTPIVVSSSPLRLFLILKGALFF
jgi:hypothetical protein